MRRTPRLLLAAIAVVAAVVAPGLTTAAQAADPAGPSVTIEPSTGLDPAGAEVTVTGTGFATTGPGIYLGITSQDLYSTSDASVYGAVQWIAPAGTPHAPVTLDADGGFTLTLNLTAQFGDGANAVDCRTTRCAVYTFAAHGSPDRSQDTATPVSFAGAADPAATGAGAPAPAGTDAVGPAATDAATGPAAAAPQPPAGDADVLAATGVDTGTLVLIGLVLFGAGGAVLLLTRHRARAGR